MIIDKLQGMSRDELVVMAMQQGLPKPHHKAKPETIIKLILDAVTHPSKPIKEEEKVTKKEIKFCTKEEVEAAIAEIKARVPEFQSVYDDEARCVTFSCRGAEDCMSLSMPLRPRPEYPMGTCIYNKAKIISRGRLVLRGHALEYFDRGTAGGKNAYTNVVLA